MDMVGESLRKNNAIFSMTECSNHLPSYLDGLTDSVMNYLWRTNDIVYLPDSPSGRKGGQYFPRPMWEKNGSMDAFRYYTHRATGGSDHICFNNSSVAVPGIELNIWPDQWYHADTDTPDKSDPTQLKRTAFIGAVAVWTAANCSDDILEELLATVSMFGYKRVGARELPRAIQHIDKANEENLDEALLKALNLVQFATEREIRAVKTTQDIFTGSERAESRVKNHIQQWEYYHEGLSNQIMKYAASRAQQMGIEPPKSPEPSLTEKKYAQIIPAIHPDVKGRQFDLDKNDEYKTHSEENPDFLKSLKLDRTQKRSILNFINGKRSITDIRNCVIAETDTKLEFETLMEYLDFLKIIGWIKY